ncbi:-domain-containing [Lecanosticta acicola]|uniref:-domain-containing n=1 Tax=Lecanosticta acicola TaxID=111012 RepID=A0AAI9E8F3_9PEZI|nr:-domain-containing [Lecanosticta acicola]
MCASRHDWEVVCVEADSNIMLAIRRAHSTAVSLDGRPQRQSLRNTGQFYKLSKANHPDLHPNDPAKAKQFVKISEAYATLGSEEKKARYDRDFMRVQQAGPTSSHTPHGSHSSATTGPGGRPASGLSRRRTQFHGPPPSFYRSGGWGEHSEKRSEHASKASHSHEARGESASGPAGPGMGPGGFAQGVDNDVPHFDNRAHTRTHSEIERNRHRTRRKRAVRYEEADLGGGSSSIFNFFVISGLLGSIALFSSAAYGAAVPSQKKQSNDS